MSDQIDDEPEPTKAHYAAVARACLEAARDALSPLEIDQNTVPLDVAALVLKAFRAVDQERDKHPRAYIDSAHIVSSAFYGKLAHFDELAPDDLAPYAGGGLALEGYVRACMMLEHADAFRSLLEAKVECVTFSEEANRVLAILEAEPKEE